MLETWKMFGEDTQTNFCTILGFERFFMAASIFLAPSNDWFQEAAQEDELRPMTRGRAHTHRRHMSTHTEGEGKNTHQEEAHGSKHSVTHTHTHTHTHTEVRRGQTHINNQQKPKQHFLPLQDDEDEVCASVFQCMCVFLSVFDSSALWVTNTFRPNQ